MAEALPSDMGVMHARRRAISSQYLRGRGIEIGALHQPLWVPEQASVQYVDRMSVEQLREQYPELAGAALTRVDRLDDGETLATFPDGSLDFVIANHVLEHTENPVGTIRSHLSKVRRPWPLGLRPGGILYYAVPDRRYTFDVERAETTWAHLREDDERGPAGSRRAHFVDYAVGVNKAVPGSAGAAAEADRLMAMNYSIHFHVWSFERFREIILAAREHLGRSFEILLLEQNEMEIVAILRRTR